MIRAGSLLVAVLVFSLTVHSLESHFHCRTSVLLKASLWALCWLLRGPRDPSRRGDLVLFSVSAAWSARHFLRGQLKSYGYSTTAFCLAAATAVVLTAWAATRRRRAGPQEKPGKPLEHLFSSPLIFKSRTTHARLFPKKHAFSYSYLLVAIPVGYTGKCGPLLSVDTKQQRGWFHVQGSDHLERSSPYADLRGKLTAYLQSQGVQDNEWAYAYLVTAPRFLGYSFNPASFWYVYDDAHNLSRMVVEVNNTFDERRMYLLHAGEEELGTDCEAGPQGQKERRDKTAFKDAWAKDFHVSPFNSRKGSYALAADDPFGGARTLPGPINTTITLKSSKNHGKLVARLFSEGAPVNPRTVTGPGVASFLASWWWVGFLTFPRILKEAWRLFFTRKLHVWFRPEVLQTSVGRNASALEKTLEDYFRRYIMHAVETSPESVCLTYRRHDGDSFTATSSSTQRPGGESSSSAAAHQDVTLQVLTPAFYGRFVHYRDTAEAFDRECLFTDEKNRTVWISNPQTLAKVFPHAKHAAHQSHQQYEPSTMERARWKLHQLLRCPPPAQSYPQPTVTDTVSVQDIRPATLSSLDQYIQAHLPEQAWLYRRTCATLFLANRFALGVSALVEAGDFLFRAVLSWHATVPTILSCDLAAAAGVLGGTVALLSMHAWSWLKGLQ